ncbi:unnamed protein product [Polarella glacialis]|uniref:RING-type domain-containing protein n=1 Tax=Polarella glacialis TaxID=89957 RepID=A0A813GM97_POLGL|nr:unnamed protein product [Polarella glacialis]
MLRPGSADDDSSLPLVVQLLQVDGSFRFGAAKRKNTDCAAAAGNTSTTTAVVYFVCFWRAMQELQDRLLGCDPADAKGKAAAQDDREPIAEEAAALREEALGLAAKGELTAVAFASLVAAHRRKSSDHEAWESLAEAARHLADAAQPQTLLPDASGNCTGTLQWFVPSGKPMSNDLLSALLLSWLFELREEYCRGSRGNLIRSVRDVTGCTTREACVHLGASRWDLEGALRSHDLQNTCNTLCALEACRPAHAGWSSQAAKIRRAERDCPICACDFRPGGSEPAVTRCCFKSICAHCVAVLVATGRGNIGEHEMLCPFCRKTEALPISTQGHCVGLPPPTASVQKLGSV